MPTQTYSDVIVSNPSHSAKLYKARLPYVILAPAISGLALILCFFLLPWFSLGLSLSSPKVPNAGSLTNVSGITLASSGVSTHVNIVNNDSSGSRNVDDSFSFPLLWAFPLVGLIQLILAFLVFKDKLLPFWLTLSLRVSFGLALLLEIIYFFVSFFAAFTQIKGAGGQIATFPGSGLWISLLLTLITGTICLIMLPGLDWYWSLARNDLARGIRISEVQADLASRRSRTSA
jgi:hypothetical protein